MSVLMKVIPCALVGVVLLAFMFGESAPSTSEPAREYVSVTVMMNSNFANGRGPSAAPCMVLFDLDQPGPVSPGKLKEMHRVAEEVYSLYEGESWSDENAEMADFIRHLKNDSYRPHCRKAVPSTLTGGRRLYVSDIMLHRDNFSPNSAMREVAVVKVTGDASGTIYHMPWNASVVPNTAIQ